tara:strand:+ start:1499 stop:1651 length:153 start_codon:yes stop_codon:yes gene_type:complete
MNEVQVKKMLKILRETEELETRKIVEDIFVEEAKKIEEWIDGRPVKRPKL